MCAPCKKISEIARGCLGGWWEVRSGPWKWSVPSQLWWLRCGACGKWLVSAGANKRHNGPFTGAGRIIPLSRNQSHLGLPLHQSRPLWAGWQPAVTISTIVEIGNPVLSVFHLWRPQRQTGWQRKARSHFTRFLFWSHSLNLSSNRQHKRISIAKKNSHDIGKLKGKNEKNQLATFQN